MEARTDLFLSRLDGLQQRGPKKWVAKCPAHQDKTPSLAITELNDGRLLVHDFGGCDTSSVMAAVGLNMGDLFPDGGSEHHHPLAFAKVEKRQAQQRAEALASARLVLDMAEAMRKEGEKLTPQDLERERKAFYALRNAGQSV